MLSVSRGVYFEFSFRICYFIYHGYDIKTMKENAPAQRGGVSASDGATGRATDGDARRRRTDATRDHARRPSASAPPRPWGPSRRDPLVACIHHSSMLSNPGRSDPHEDVNTVHGSHVLGIRRDSNRRPVHAEIHKRCRTAKYSLKSMNPFRSASMI